jgi:hypothetical protein
MNNSQDILVMFIIKVGKCGIHLYFIFLLVFSCDGTIGLLKKQLWKKEGIN